MKQYHKNMSKQELINRCKVLEEIVNSFYWMARRYADGRRSYAVGMCNDSLDKMKELNLEIRDDVTIDNSFYARDGNKEK